MPDELEVGDRAPNFELPACYGYKAGASSPSAEEKVKVSLKDFEDKKWVVLAFYRQDSSPEDTRLMVGFNEWNRKFKTREVEVLGCSWNGVNSHQQFIEVFQFGFTLLADEHKKVTELYGVIKEEEDLGEMVKYIERATFVIDKTGMIRAIWRNPEDLRDHPADIWEFIQKEKKAYVGFSRFHKNRMDSNLLLSSSQPSYYPFQRTKTLECKSTLRGRWGFFFLPLYRGKWGLG